MKPVNDILLRIHQQKIALHDKFVILANHLFHKWVKVLELEIVIAVDKFRRYYVSEYGIVELPWAMKKEIYARGPIS